MENIYVRIAMASKALKRAGFSERAKEMVERIDKNAQSYEEAVKIIKEYVSRA